MTAPAPLFPLGQVLATPGAISLMEAHGIDSVDLLRRHVSGDWGDLCPEDAMANDSALAHGGRLFSAYGHGHHRFWIITEADRSVTTVLLPEDY